VVTRPSCRCGDAAVVRFRLLPVAEPPAEYVAGTARSGLAGGFPVLGRS